MQTNDIEKFIGLIGEVAECFDHRPITEVALKHWFDALSEFNFADIEYQLRLWIKSKPRFPMIADIFSILNEQAIDKRETAWNEKKIQEAAEIKKLGITEQGKTTLEMIRKIINKS